MNHSNERYEYQVGSNTWGVETFSNKGKCRSYLCSAYLLLPTNNYITKTKLTKFYQIPLSPELDKQQLSNTHGLHETLLNIPRLPSAHNPPHPLCCTSSDHSSCRPSTWWSPPTLPLSPNCPHTPMPQTVNPTMTWVQHLQSQTHPHDHPQALHHVKVGLTLQAAPHPVQSVGQFEELIKELKGEKKLSLRLLISETRLDSNAPMFPTKPH